MARPIKKGLDYFPIDTDIFDNIQIRKLKKQYKSLGFLAYFTLLCDIYKKEGYFLQMSDDYVYDLSERLGETEETVQEIIAYCLQVNLFNRQKYDLYNVLTSKSVQERYIQAQKRCKNAVRKEFDCINVTETVVSATETTRNVTKSAHIILDNIISKESKVNKEEEEEEESACAKQLEPKATNRDGWKIELLSDEDWRALLVRYSGKGMVILNHVEQAMAVFDDYMQITFKSDTIHSKKDYAERFVGWWRYHNFNLKMEELSGGIPKNIPRITTSPSARPEQKSKIENLIETGNRATEIAMRIYNNQAV